MGKRLLRMVLLKKALESKYYNNKNDDVYNARTYNINK